MRSSAWLRYLVVGVLCVAGHAALPPSLGRDLFGVLIGASAIAAVVVGVRANRPAVRTPWLLFAGGLAGLVGGDLVWAVLDWRGIEPFPSPGDLVYLVGYVAFSVGLLRLGSIRRPGGDLRSMLDAAVIAVCATLVLVVLYVTPGWGAEGTLADRVIGTAYPIADVVLLVQLVHVRGAGNAWTPALRNLGRALVCILVGDLLFQAAPYVPWIEANVSYVDGLWLLGYIFVGAAALHPSMAPATALQKAAPSTVRATLQQRLNITYTVSVVPGVVLVEILAGGEPHMLEAAIAGMLVVWLIHARIVSMTGEMVEQAERLARLADADVLTGLANLRRFTEEVEERLTDSRVPAVPVLLVVLDRFTEINDTLGHRVGDELLCGVAARMTSVVAEHGMVARVGGDTFGVVVEDQTYCSAEVLGCAEKLRRELVAPFELSDVTVSIDALVGVAVGPEDGTTVDELMQRADIALSAARESIEKVARYSGRMTFEATYAPHLVGELSDALEAGDIVVHYQPKVVVATGLVVGVEALVRWQHPLHGLLPPAAFISAAERTGLIRPLTRYVLDRALEQVAKWHAEGRDLSVAVNLSVRDLLDPELVDEVREAIVRHKVAPDFLELEITETMAMVDPARSLVVLEGLDAMGVTLSVDDYGTGYSSLAYLQRLPVHRLKIDRSFVTGMVEDRASEVIVRSTIELARNLGMIVVAEGVEDDATLLALREMACDEAQGFGLGHPVPAEDLLPLVAVVEELVPRILEQGVPVGRRMV
jgi:diguanylate cyclase (GGDEF)-like protein